MLGNCFVCACVIWCIYGGKWVTTTRTGTRVPHWLVKCKDGKVRHFVVVRDILPKPLGYFLFVGKVEALGHDLLP